MRSSRGVVLMVTAYRRLANLDRVRRRLLFEAVAAITVVGVGLRVLPFLKLRRGLDRFAELPIVRRQGPASSDVVPSVQWAMMAASARLRATCLVQALAAGVMLRRRGLACRLRLGVRTREVESGVRLEAHAWIECDGRIAIGDVAHLSELAVMPPPGSP